MLCKFHYMEITDYLDIQMYPISILMKSEKVGCGFIYGLVTPTYHIIYDIYHNIPYHVS